MTVPPVGEVVRVAVGGPSSGPSVGPSLGPSAGVAGVLEVCNLGRCGYVEAYQRQLAAHARVLADRAEEGGSGALRGVVLIVEHDPVITVSQRPDAASHLLASREALASLGVDVQSTDRGGDVTYHGPGQIVLYPVLDLNAFGLRLHDYMRLLEEAVIRTLASYGLAAERDATATGVWVRSEASVAWLSKPGENSAAHELAKIAAMGVRVRRWISLHGLALNVTVNLQHFNLIVPCGLVGRPVTSLDRFVTGISFEAVTPVLVGHLARLLAEAAGRPRAAGSDDGGTASMA